MDWIDDDIWEDSLKYVVSFENNLSLVHVLFVIWGLIAHLSLLIFHCLQIY